MLISMYAFPGSGRDPARLAAQVVSGIGFLGAGTIMREGSSIKGLTTAASLWVVSGIGLAVGSGFYLAAILTTALAVLTLVFLDNIEHKYLTGTSIELQIMIDDKPGEVGKLGTLLGEMGINISALELEDSQNHQTRVSLRLNLPLGMEKMFLLDKLGRLEGINKIQVEN